MENHDENFNTFNPAPMGSTIKRYGMIGGLVMIVLALVGILTGLSSPSNLMGSSVFGLIAVVAYVILMVIAVKHQRGMQNGYITLGQAFKTAFGTAALAALFGLLFNIIYMGFIDPDYMLNAIEESRAMYEAFGMDEDMIDEAMEKAREGATLGGLIQNQLIGYVVGAIIGAIISLIVGAVMKKEPAQVA